MKILLGVVLLGAGVLYAQTPNLSGVWKANPEKSKISAPPGSTYLAIFEQTDDKLKETIGISNPRGEQRMAQTFNTDGKPSLNRGGTMRTISSWDGGTLVLNSKVIGGRPATIVEKYTLAPDGNTLTVDTVTTANGKETTQKMVLEKQPDSAAEALRKPEQTAGVHYKNVTLLKDVPASQFIDAMRSFEVALGVGCEHCHVQGKFDADDKPAKIMARKMITMTHAINEQAFAGKLEVRCYTCHQGHEEPQSRPAF